MNFELINILAMFLGGILSVALGAVLTYYFTKKTQEKKSIRLTITNPEELINISEKIGDRLEIYLDGQPVKAVMGLRAIILNTGNRAIEGIEINLRVEGTEIIACESTENNNQKDLIRYFKKSQNDLGINISLMNPGDEISINIFTTSLPTNVDGLFKQPNVTFQKRILDKPISTFAEYFLEMISKNALLNIFFLPLMMPTYREWLRRRKYKSSNK